MKNLISLYLFLLWKGAFLGAINKIFPGCLNLHAHDHVGIEESGNTHVSPWNYLIVLEKIEGEWKIIAISENKSESQ